MAILHQCQLVRPEESQTFQRYTDIRRQNRPPIKTSEVEILPAVILAELMVRLSSGTGGAVRLQVGETFVDLGLVTDTGNPTPVGVTQGRHQAAAADGDGGDGVNQPAALGWRLY